MTLLRLTLHRILSHICPHLNSAFYTGYSTEAINDFAALILLAENIKHFGALNADELADAGNFVVNFLEIVNKNDIVKFPLTMDVEECISWLHFTPKKRVGTKRKQSNRQRRRLEMRWNAKHDNSEEESEDNRILMTSVETIACPLRDDQSSGEEKTENIDWTAVWDKRLMSYYKRTHNNNCPKVLSKSDVILLSLIILHGIESVEGSVKKMGCLPFFSVLKYDDHLEADTTTLQTISQIIYLMSHVYSHGLRQNPTLYDPEEVEENLRSHLVQMTEYAVDITSAALHSDDVTLLSSPLTNPTNYLSVLSVYMDTSNFGDDKLPLPIEQSIRDWILILRQMEDEQTLLIEQFIGSILQWRIYSVDGRRNLCLMCRVLIENIESTNMQQVLSFLEELSQSEINVYGREIIWKCVFDLFHKGVRSCYIQPILDKSLLSMDNSKNEHFQPIYRKFVVECQDLTTLISSFSAVYKASATLSITVLPIFIDRSVKLLKKFPQIEKFIDVVRLINGIVKGFPKVSISCESIVTLFLRNFSGMNNDDSYRTLAISLSNLLARRESISSDEKRNAFLGEIRQTLSSSNDFLERDIWLFLSSSDVYSEFYKNLRLLEVFLETGSPLNCSLTRAFLNRLLHHCLEWGQNPSSHTRELRRWADLTACTLNSLIMLGGVESRESLDCVVEFRKKLCLLRGTSSSSPIEVNCALARALFVHSLEGQSMEEDSEEASIPSSIGNVTKEDIVVCSSCLWPLALYCLRSIFRVLNAEVSSSKLSFATSTIWRTIQVSLLTAPSVLPLSTVRETVEALIGLFSDVTNPSQKFTDEEGSSVEATASDLSESIGHILTRLPQPELFKKWINVISTNISSTNMVPALTVINRMISVVNPPYTIQFPVPLPSFNDNLGTNDSNGASISLDDHPVVFSEGMTISTWLSIECALQESFHVMSIRVGSVATCALLLHDEGKMAEVTIWSDQNCQSIEKFKLPQDSGRFIHLTLGVRHFVNGKEQGLRVQATIGNKYITSDVNTVQKTDDPDSERLFPQLGAFSCYDWSAPSYTLCNVFGFKGLLSCSCLFTLTSLGPSLRSLFETFADRPTPCLPNALTANLITRNEGFFVPFVESVIIDPFKFVTHLQKQLHFFIAADSPNVLVYVGRPSPISESEHLMRKMTIVSTVHFNNSLFSIGTETLDESFTVCGGISTFLALYALFVDNGASASTQLCALQLVLHYSRRWSALKEPGRKNMVDVLSRIFFAADVESTNIDIVSILCEYCMRTQSSDPLSPSPEDSVLLTDPEALVCFLERSFLWTFDHRFKLWSRTVQCLVHSLTLNNQILATFNAHSLRNVNALHRLLQAVTELIKKEACCDSCDSLWSGDIPKNISLLVQSLMGDPPQLDAVMALWNFIVHTHPPDKMYISRVQHSFTEWLDVETVAPLDKEFPFPEGSSELTEQLGKYFDEIPVDLKSCSTRKDVSMKTLRELYEGTIRRKYGEATDVQSEASPLAPIDEIRPKESAAPCSGVNILRTEMIRLLATTIELGPDSLIAGLLHDVIGWQCIICLLTEQSDLGVRTAVVELLFKFLLRAPNFTKAVFVEFRGSQLLANQIRGFPSSRQMISSVFGMILGEPINISKGFDQEHLEMVIADRLKCDSVHALLAVFVESTNTQEDFQFISSGISKMLLHCQFRYVLLEYSLVDAMTCALQKILRIDLPEIQGDQLPEQFPQVILDWLSLAGCVVRCGVLYDDSNMYEGVKRLVWSTLLLDHHYAAIAKENETRQNLCVFWLMRRILSYILCVYMSEISNLSEMNMRSASAAPSIDSLDSFEDLSDDLSYDSSITPGRALRMYGTSPMQAFLGGQFANMRERAARISGWTESALRCPHPYRQISCSVASSVVLTERFTFLLDITASSLTFIEMIPASSEEELTLLESFARMLSDAYKRPTNGIWRFMEKIANSRAKKALSKLSAFLIYPAQEYFAQCMSFDGHSGVDHTTNSHRFLRRYSLLKLLTGLIPKFASSNGVSDRYPKSDGFLKDLLRISMDDSYTFCLGLIDLAFLTKKTSETDIIYDNTLLFVEMIHTEIKRLRERSPFDFLNNSHPDAIAAFCENEKLAAFSYESERRKLYSILKAEAHSVFAVERSSKESVEAMAMSLTTEVSEQVRTTRRLLVEAPREIIRRLHASEDLLMEYYKSLFHPGAPLHTSSAWPNGVELDLIEGPNRERRRMRPAEFDIDPKFLNSCDHITPFVKPFSRIFSSGSFSRRNDELTVIDAYVFHCDVTEVRATIECDGDLVVAKEHLHLLPKVTRTTHKQLPMKTCEGFRIPYCHITEIWERKYLLKDMALEVFVKDGPARMLVFSDAKIRDEFRDCLRKLGFGHVFGSVSRSLTISSDQWRRGRMTNFAYLMLLNKLAGRSYNDLMQYPVFPFVLCQYRSPNIDLANASNFRCFDRPMPVQDRSKEDHYVSQYETLESSIETSHAPYFGPYHYGSHYSNSGIVAHYMVRMMPFTKLALEYQDQSFDIPDRLFNSIDSIWKLSSSESTSDFKELTPEFFYCPEFLQNLHDLNLGVRQNGEKVGNVALPNWVGSDDYRMFTLVHRQALESSHVTANLDQWINLIFGYKQTGKPAKEAINVFHPSTYVRNGADIEDMDEVTQNALITMVRTYGQMPTQLFNSPHQPHLYPGKQTNTLQIQAPWPAVENIRWGEFVGSPRMGDVTHSTVHRTSCNNDRVSNLICTPDGTMVGAAKNVVTAVNMGDPKDEPQLSGVLRCVVGTFSYDNLVTGLIRFKPVIVDGVADHRTPWTNAICAGTQQITSLSYSTAGILFVGFSSGVIHAYNVEFDMKGLKAVSLRGTLLGHDSTITYIHVCDEFGLITTACSGGRVLQWDCSELRFVKKVVRELDNAVTLIHMSKVSGDMAMVSHTRNSSVIELVTINGASIGRQEVSSTVTALTMTNLPEGTAVNCLLAGCQDSKIRVIELWRGKVIGDLSAGSNDPVVAMEFTTNHRRLFVAKQSGYIVTLKGTNDKQAKDTFVHCTAH